MSVDKETARIANIYNDPLLFRTRKSESTVKLHKEEIVKTQTFGELTNRIEKEFEIRGGFGNKVLFYSSIEERLLGQIHKGLREDLMDSTKIDYSNPTTFPKEWSNIQWGKDTLKLNKKDKLYLKLIGISFSGIVGWIIYLIF